MQYKPLDHKIIIKIESKQQITKKGLIYLSSSQQKSNERIVIAAGPGRITDKGFKMPMQTKVGDIVLFDPEHRRQIDPKDSSLLVMFDGDVIAVLEEN